jgi:hypothetical protein
MVMLPGIPKEIPYYVAPPPLSPTLMDEITLINIGNPMRLNTATQFLYQAPGPVGESC